MQVFQIIRGCLACGLILTWSTMLHADPVHNGNELALKYAEADAVQRAGLRQERTGVLHTFRHLRVVEITFGTGAVERATVVTVEPSSDLRVRLVTSQPLSLALARTLQTNECVAASGRIRSLGTDAPGLMVVDPAILTRRDRAAPPDGAETLHQADPGRNAGR